MRVRTYLSIAIPLVGAIFLLALARYTLSTEQLLSNQENTDINILIGGCIAVWSITTFIAIWMTKREGRY